MAIYQRYPTRRFTTLCRVGGAGFRTLARLDHHRNVHFGRVWAMYTKALAPSFEAIPAKKVLLFYSVTS